MCDFRKFIRENFLRFMNSSERNEEKLKKDEEKRELLEKTQAEASEKQKRRTDLMGELLRSKGFFWLATSNDVIGGWQQAGNVLR